MLKSEHIFALQKEQPCKWDAIDPTGCSGSQSRWAEPCSSYRSCLFNVSSSAWRCCSCSISSAWLFALALALGAAAPKAKLEVQCSLCSLRWNSSNVPSKPEPHGETLPRELPVWSLTLPVVSQSKIVQVCRHCSTCWPSLIGHLPWRIEVESYFWWLFHSLMESWKQA